ncbi:MAG: hypothetical protein JWQ63_1849 [Mucilaginibacter sp.]|nr:hypothetical protein [Mucilaginibacter sp.]
MERTNPFGIQDDGKTAGLLSYFFVLGWSMAFFTFHKYEKTSLSSFHLRQTLLLYITYLFFRYGLSFFLSAIGFPIFLLSMDYYIVLVNITFIILWIIGLNGASKAELKPIPVLGRVAQNIFSRIS